MDRFLIAPFNTGLQKNIRPWLVMDDAFEELTNAYVFRGRVRKRFGSKLMGTLGQRSSRLRINLGNTDGAGNFNMAAIGGAGAIWKIGQMFSVGTQLFTVFQANGAMLASAGTGTGTFDTATGTVAIMGADALTPVYFYQAEPVMGLANYETGTINDQPSYAFDTRFAYEWTGNGWDLSTNSPTWQGDNLNFFWTTNWQGLVPEDIVLFVTNFNATVPGPALSDPMYYYDGTNWFPFTPQFTVAGDFVQTARLIVAFKGRLVLLDTIEQSGGANAQFVNRARFSHLGSPLSATAWLNPNEVGATGAGFIDAATEEEIISAEFIKDRLIVYFEQSTWELVYTYNEQEPFTWQKINTELGSESQFSTVPFDKEVLTVGDVGIHSCSGANVFRIDEKIPDEVFQIKNKNISMQRVAGIRDYYTELVYWTFPASNAPSFFEYPNRVLVYNYQNKTWAFNDDVFTAWGYFQQQNDITWVSSAPIIWAEFNNTWESGIVQQQFRQVLGGNQEGFVLIIMSDISRNAPSLQITNIVGPAPTLTLTVIDHTIRVGEYILIETVQGTAGITNQIFRVLSTPNANTLTISAPNFAGAYIGGGTIARVSNINILSKQWNPYDSKGRNLTLSKIDFGIQKTSDGEVTIDYAPSAADLSILNNSQAGAILGTGVLETKPYDPAIYPLEQYQDRLWHPVYFQGAQGECIQIRIFMNDIQMTTPIIALSDFELEGLILHTQPTSARMQ